MKIFSSISFLFLFTLTAVLAIPPPLTELLESSIEEVSKGIESLPALKEPAPSAPKPRLLSLIEKKLSSNNNEQVIAPITPPSNPLKNPSDSTSLELSAMNTNVHLETESVSKTTTEMKPAAVNKMGNLKINKELNPLKKKIVSFSPEVSTMIVVLYSCSKKI